MVLHRDHRTDIASLAIDETILATQNNYLGVRANFEENVPYQTTIRGTYINGFYDTHSIPYGESAYGFPEKGETIVNVPDAQTITLWLGETPVNLNYAKLIELKRRYHLKDGFTTRSALYEMMDGVQLWIHTKRLTHLSFKPLFMIDYTVESVNYDGEIRIESRLDGNVENYVSTTDMRAGTHEAKRLKTTHIDVQEGHAQMDVETLSTHFQCTVGLTHSKPFHYEAINDAISATKIIQLTYRRRIIWLPKVCALLQQS